jgi:hypothetical protein
VYGSDALAGSDYNFLQEKAEEATKQKEKKKKTLSPRNRKAGHSVSIAFLKSVAATTIGIYQNRYPRTSRYSNHLLVEFDYRKQALLDMDKRGRPRGR